MQTILIILQALAQVETTSNASSLAHFHQFYHGNFVTKAFCDRFVIALRLNFGVYIVTEIWWQLLMSKNKQENIVTKYPIKILTMLW